MCFRVLMYGRNLLLPFLAAMAISCGSGRGSDDAATDQDETGDVDAADDAQADQDADQDPDPDPDPDSAGDTALDTGAEYDTTEAGHVCGNFVVEPGEDCDPPTSSVECTTTCGSRGEGECTDECLAPEPADCEPPEETCDFADEDCDGMVDEGTLASWTAPTLLSAEEGASTSRADVAWTGEAFAVAWVVEPASGPPDSVHLALVDAIGGTVLPDTALAVPAADVLGRPGLAWTGSSILLAWNTSDAGGTRNVAILDEAGTVASLDQQPATGLAGSTDVAWAGSHAAVVWIESVSGDPEVMLGFAAGDGTAGGTPIRLTSATGAASMPVVDADGAAILAAWIDARTGSDVVRFAAVGHDGSTIAADAAIPSGAGATSPAVSAAHRTVAWIDSGSGSPAARAVTLDPAWAAGTPVDVAAGGRLLLASAADRLMAAVDGNLATLGTDAAPQGALVPLGTDPVAALAWGSISVAAAGASTTGSTPALVLALAGCARHDACTSWMPSLEPVATRTGRDDLAYFTGHDAALSGSWDDRPVTYLSIQMFQADPRGGPVVPGGYLLTGAGYEICGLCVLLYEDCGASTCERTYLARGGRLDLASIGPIGTTLAGTLEDVQLAEVEIDSSSMVSTWVPGGREICLGRYGFSETIEPY